jgi:hypothetical protein
MWQDYDPEDGLYDWLDECPICRGTMGENRWLLINCAHSMCRDCLRGWRTGGAGNGTNLCPLCRTMFAEDEPDQLVDLPQVQPYYNQDLLMPGELDWLQGQIDLEMAALPLQPMEPSQAQQ